MKTIIVWLTTGNTTGILRNKHVLVCVALYVMYAVYVVGLQTVMCCFLIPFVLGTTYPTALCYPAVEEGTDLMVGALGHHHQLGLVVGVEGGAGLVVGMEGGAGLAAGVGGGTGLAGGVGGGAALVPGVEDGAVRGRGWAGHHSQSCSRCVEGGHSSGGPCQEGQVGEAAVQPGGR